MNAPSRNALAGVALTSMSVLMLELSLTRLFSATMYYHFAFLAISLALFGSGASGVFLYLIRERIPPESASRWLAINAALFAATTIVAVFVVLGSPLEIGGDNYWRLGRIYAAAALPFFFGGVAITLAIRRYAESVARVYLFDLVGAAIGCVLLIPVLNALGAISGIFLIAALALVASLFFAADDKSLRMPLAFALVVVLALAGLNSATGWLDIRGGKGRDFTRLLFSKWNSFSFVTVEGKLEEPRLAIRIDSDAETLITRNAGRYWNLPNPPPTIEGLVHFLHRGGDVLIIGPGGGNDILLARAFGQRSITGVEVNPIIARDVMLSEPFLSYSARVYNQPGVNLVVDEGRSFIRSSDKKYDIIQANMVDTWAATAGGAFALAENNLYTVEAFKDYLDHLTDDGYLAMTRWYLEPPDQLLRLISIARAALDELGIENHDRHFILARYSIEGVSPPASFIMKKSAFTDEEVRRIESVAKHARLEILYTPLTRPTNEFTALITAQNPDTIWRKSRTNISPTRDNNPFFFNSARLSGMRLDVSEEWKKTNLGTYVLIALVKISAVVVLLFIIGPLFLSGRGVRGKRNLSFLLYFACLGGGFIIVEIAMIQKFILFLGHPVYSLAVVLFALLCFSGIGSGLSGRISQEALQRNLVRILSVLLGAIAVYVAVLSPIFYGLVHLPVAARIAIAVALLAPLAMLMGMPMPTGIRLLAAEAPEVIPWAWGLNGAMSVLGSAGALAIAIVTGFNQALFVGASLYALALLAVFLMGRR